ncbi:MAG: hypothetical protein NZ989_08350 [Bacteroidia bacterium]|nr:hypothetical protein [Bacteroidia bacterium]MDW8058268.1 multiheme c-type cytochrome [Bacteroidia bacterium]
MRWGGLLLSLSFALYLSCQPSEKGPPPLHYVGDEVCQKCHPNIVRAYAVTWKAHSLLPVTPSLKRIENFSQPAVYDPHSGFYYRAVWEGDSLFLYEYRLSGRDTTYLRRERLDFVIGSGHQTRSYLIWRNGFLYEAPLTWYVLPQKWDLSPGYADGKNSRFSREIQPSCLACHASGWEAVPWTYNRYHKVGGAIGCEACHGPGSRHVENPHDTAYHWSRWSPLRQMDVCSRCHLEGIAVEKRTGWKPGDTLSAFWAIFLPERAELGRFGIASHAERLLRSACYQKGGVTCSTCHNPHPREAVPSYDSRCMSCHTKGCSDLSHPTRDCAACHMPKGESSDIPHTRFTDHYIRVVKSQSPSAPLHRPLLVCATEMAPDSALVGEAYLKWYNEENTAPWVLEEALRILSRHGRPFSRAKAYLLSQKPKEALPWAERALSQDTTLQTLELYGYLLEMSGLLEKALSVWETLKHRAPAYPEARFRWVLLAYQLGKLTPAQAYEALRGLTQEQPWNAQFQYNAAVFAGMLGRLPVAKSHLQAALSYEPDYKPAQEALRRLQ